MASTSVTPSRPGLLPRLLQCFRTAPTALAATVEPRRVSPENIGRGFADPRHGAGVKRIVVTTDSALFDRVHAVAVASEISMAAAVRQLIERGLEARSTQTP